MLRTKFDIHDLTKSAAQIACLVPAEDVFSLLARSITIPAGWIALASRRDLDPLLLLGGQRCDAPNVLDLLFVRTARLEAGAQHETLQSSDGFACLGRISLPVRVLTERAELAAFRKTFLGSHNSLIQSGLDRFLNASLQKALSDLAQSHTAAQLVAGLDRTTIHKAVEQRIGPICLSAGLALDAPPTATFESPAWVEHHRQESQLEQRRRHTESRAQIQEAVAAAQRQQLDHLLSILKNLSDAANGGSIGLPALLTGFGDAERGQLYAALWHLPAAGATRCVVVVSGCEVLLFEPDELQQPARRLKLPNTLGPLRSISTVRDSIERTRLLVGAAQGVYLLDLETGQPARALRAPVDPTRPVQGGFNAATATDTRVFATHSELGLVAWRLDDEPDIPGHSLLAHLTRAATAVRCARVSDGHLWCTVDACLWAVPLENLDSAQGVLYRCAAATLSALCFDQGSVYAGDASGTIRVWDVGEPESVRIVRNATGRPVESLQVIDTCGVPRLIIADRSSGLTAMVLGDQYARRYEAGSAIIRRAAAAPDLFVAMNDARDRLIVWDPRRADAPVASVVIPHLTGSTLQDLALVPA